MKGSSFRNIRFFKLWMDDPKAALVVLLDEIEKRKLFKPDIIQVDTGQVLLNENRKNRKVYLLLEGTVHLYKSVENQGTLPVTKVSPGNMFGVMSFFSGKDALTSAIATEKTKVLSLSKSDVEILLNADQVVAGMSRQLLISNLMERYTQVVELNVELKQVNTRLDEERIRLDEALSKLQDAHQRLIHQEKMATLGQLVAGIAHEMNNPAAALSNAADYLAEILPEIFTIKPEGEVDQRMLFFRDGLSSKILSTEKTRVLIANFEVRFPDLKRSEIRKLINLSDEALQILEVLYAEGSINQLNKYLKYTDAGMHLRSIRITSGRISNLVKSLKRYSRHESTSSTTTDLKEGLFDTIHILGNRLKNIELEIQIPESIPEVKADPAEINQVWTNILVNACDAVKDEGRIYIRCTYSDDRVNILIGDDGPGINPELRDKIFMPHFTTRNSSGNFGLGLGLSISKNLALKNGGDIKVGESSYGGAEFCIELPVLKSIEE
jgi:signal transduction histidine kinase